MKVMLRDLANIADEKVYQVDIQSYIVENNIYLRRLENVSGDLSFYYDINDELRINYALSGKMICPDSFTLEDVEIPFELSEDEKVVRNPELEGFFFDKDMTIDELVAYIVLPEAPIKVEKSEKIEYSSGDGWSFVSEKDYESSLGEEIDPRLQKLKEYKFEED